jgi:hypothetical protein
MMMMGRKGNGITGRTDDDDEAERESNYGEN